MTHVPKILIVDDEPQIHRFLRPSLVASGYDVMSAATAADGLRQAAQASAVILDLGLPDMDGKDALREMRRRGDVPVVVLSARNQEAEKIAALDLGADDYVDKPFTIGELLARIRSVLRRRRPKAAQPVPLRLAVGHVTIDSEVHEVRRDGELVHLTPKEFELLAMLARHAGRVVTHRQILTEVWGPAHAADTQYLRVFVGQLRQKLEHDPAAPTLITTEPGVGYRIADAG